MRLFLILASAVALAAPACAQDGASPHVALYLGYTSATLHGDSVPGPTHTGGGVAGISLRRRIQGPLDLQAEAQFVQKGDEETDVANGGAFHMHIRLNYLEIPVLLRLNGDEMRGMTPFLIAGPQIAFKIGCGIVVTGLAGNYTCRDLPPAQGSEWGAVAGGGIDFGLLGQPLTLSARFDWGLSDAFKDNLGKTRTASAILGWRMR